MRFLPIGAAITTAMLGAAASKRGMEGVLTKTVSLSRSSGQKTGAAPFDATHTLKLPSSRPSIDRVFQLPPSPLTDVTLKSFAPIVVGHFGPVFQTGLIYDPSVFPLSVEEWHSVAVSASPPNLPSTSVFRTIVAVEQEEPLGFLVDDLLSYMVISKYVSDELLALQSKLETFRWDRGQDRVDTSELMI